MLQRLQSLGVCIQGHIRVGDDVLRVTSVKKTKQGEVRHYYTEAGPAPQVGATAIATVLVA